MQDPRPKGNQDVEQIEQIASRINAQFERLARSGLSEQEQYDIVVRALQESGMLPDSVMQ